MPNPFGFPRISEVSGLAEVPPSQSVLFDLGPGFCWAQAPEFSAKADQDLELEGDLVQFTQTHDVSFQKIEPLPEATRKSAFSRWSQSELWQVCSRTGQSGVRYTIVVGYHDYSEMVLANDDMKAQVMEFFHRESARCLLMGQPGDSLSYIEKIGQKIMYRFGIPYRRMGFFLDRLKSISRLEPLGSE